jgi:hypothetical protein
LNWPLDCDVTVQLYAQDDETVTSGTLGSTMFDVYVPLYVPTIFTKVGWVGKSGS